MARDDFELRSFESLEEGSKGRSLTTRFMFVLNDLFEAQVINDYAKLCKFVKNMIKLRDSK